MGILGPLSRLVRLFWRMNKQNDYGSSNVSTDPLSGSCLSFKGRVSSVGESSFSDDVFDEVDGEFNSYRQEEAIKEAAHRLGRPVEYIDSTGYVFRIFGAAISTQSHCFAYVEVRARQFGLRVDISVKIHLHDSAGESRSINIESHNPYFGCIIHSFRWIGSRVFLFYKEKHDTVGCLFGDLWPPRFIEMADDWRLKDAVVVYIGYIDCYVRKRHLSNRWLLDFILEPIDAEEAKMYGMHPLF